MELSKYACQNRGVDFDGFWCQVGDLWSLPLIFLGDAKGEFLRKLLVFVPMECPRLHHFKANACQTRNDVHNKVKDIQNSLNEENKKKNSKRLIILVVLWVWHGQGTKLDPLIVVSKVKYLLVDVWRDWEIFWAKFSLGRCKIGGFCRVSRYKLGLDVPVADPLSKCHPRALFISFRSGCSI